MLTFVFGVVSVSPFGPGTTQSISTANTTATSRAISSTRRGIVCISTPILYTFLYTSRLGNTWACLLTRACGRLDYRFSCVPGEGICIPHGQRHTIELQARRVPNYGRFVHTLDTSGSRPSNFSILSHSSHDAEHRPISSNRSPNASRKARMVSIKSAAAPGTGCPPYAASYA